MSETVPPTVRTGDVNPRRWPQLTWCRACEVGTLERRCWNCGAALGLPLWLDGLSLVSTRRTTP